MTAAIIDTRGRIVVYAKGIELFDVMLRQTRQATAGAVDAAGDAADSAAAAQLAESGAVAANGTLYPDIATGLAATTEGDYFTVVGDGTNTYAILYRKVSGAEVEQAQYASKAAFEGPAGFTLIRYKRPESGTFARTAAQRVLAGISNDGLYVNEWIDPALDEQISHNNQGISVDLSAAFNTAISTAASLISRGSLAAIKIASGYYTVGQTIETSFTRMSIEGQGRVLIEAMSGFSDPLFEIDNEVVRPRIIACDAHATPSSSWIRNHNISNIIVRGNGEDIDAFFDRGVANSHRTRLISRNIGGACAVILAGVDSYYAQIQSQYAAEGVDSEQRPMYGLYVGRSIIGTDPEATYSATTQCSFNTRIEEADVAGVHLAYSDTCKYTGMAEELIKDGVVVGPASIDNDFYHFYCEANGGLDFDIWGAKTLIRDRCTTYNNRDEPSIRVRPGAFLNTIQDIGNLKTIIQIDAEAEYTQLRNITAKNIIDNSSTTHYSGYIFNLTESGSPQYP